MLSPGLRATSAIHDRKIYPCLGGQRSPSKEMPLSQDLNDEQMMRESNEHYKNKQPQVQGP